MNEKTDVSVEQVALLAQQNTLPEPTLDISMLSYSAAAQPQSLAAVATATYNHTQPTTSATQQASGGSSSPATTTIAAGLRSTAVPPPPADDPWGARYGGAGPFGAPGGDGLINGGGAPPSSVSGTGLPSGWWKRLEKVTVQFSGQQGFVLNRYMLYGITTEVRRFAPW